MFPLFKDFKFLLKRQFYTHFSNNIKKKSYYKFLEVNGEETYRINYPLNKNSIVVDVGGYIGDFAEAIFDKFGCTIVIFEPVEKFVKVLEERFRNNSNIIIVNAGLNSKNNEVPIYIDGSSSSIFKHGRLGNKDQQKITLISITDCIKNLKYPKIDLMKINIEGGEYDLLNSLINNKNVLARIKFLQIQFHDFIPNAVEKRKTIRFRLSSTHKLMWDFPFIWESWRVKRNE